MIYLETKKWLRKKVPEGWEGHWKSMTGQNNGKASGTMENRSAQRAEIRGQYVRCDLCGVDDSELLIEKQAAFYVRCRRCGFIYANPRFTGPLDLNRDWIGEKMQKYVDSHYRTRSKKQRRHIRLIKMFEPYRHTNRILEVGCNVGGFLFNAKQMGWRETGIELVPDLARYGREEKGLDILCGALEEADLPDNEFDVVFSNAVIEHLSSPATMLAMVFRVLRPGGAVYTRTLNYDSYTVDMYGIDWRLLSPVGHPSIFTSHTLQRFHRDAGFEILNVWSERVGVPRGRKGLYPRFLKKFFLGMLAPLTLRGDRVAVLARKPISK